MTRLIYLGYRVAEWLSDLRTKSEVEHRRRLDAYFEKHPERRA